MTDILQNLGEQIQAAWPWEAIAVALAIAYLVLAIRQNIACWLAAIASTVIYLWLFLQVNLYMESALQVFYIVMAVYGWYSWSHGGSGDRPLAVSSWPLAFLLAAAVCVALASLLTGYLLAGFTDAALPYLDSLTSWGAVVCTWMVARKIIQNWHGWFLVDSLSVYLYATRGLWLTVLLFCLYLVLIVIGYRSWRKTLPVQQR